MQKVKLVMRHVSNTPHNEFMSAKDVEEHIEYTYLSEGWKVLSQSVTDVYDDNRKFEGYRILFTLVKDQE